MAASGFTPILIYASGTASNVPLAANLTSSASGAELALNYADGKLYFKNSSGVVTLLAGAGGAGVVAGSNTQIQFNNSGVFGASANLTWDGSKVTASAYQTGGNLTFTGTGNRITGDFTNATVASRVAFQTSTTNGNTIVPFIPNGSATQTNLILYNSSDVTTNFSLFTIRHNATASSFASSIGGTGTYVPITFETGGSERMRLDTSGNVGIGTSSPNAKIDVQQNQAALSYLFDTYNYTNGGGSVWRMITRNIANTGTTSVDFYKPSASGFYINNNDTNAGAFTAFGIGASERMRIDSSGNVGIGTSSPGYKLDVQGATASTQLKSTTGTNYVAHFLNNTGGFTYLGVESSAGGSLFTGTAAYEAVFGTVNSYPVGFATGGAERMRIDTSGNVGIGTASPGQKLQVSGAIMGVNGYADGLYIQNATSGSYNRLILGQTAAAGAYIYTDAPGGVASTLPLSFWTSGVRRMDIDSSGNVGIGTSSPGYKLDVNGGIRMPNATVFWFNNASGTAQETLQLYSDNNTYLSTPGALILRTNGTTERMRIDSSGNLLLGTTSGTARLVVNGGTSTSQIRWEVNNAAFTQEVSTNAAANAYVYKTNDALYHVWKLSSAEAMRLDSSGNVGIGTSSPGFKLQVSGAIYQDNGYAQFGNYNAGGANSPVAGGISFSTNATNGQAEADVWNGNDPALYANTGILFTQRLTSTTRRDLMFLHNNGNVGIGTNSPNGKLDVSSSGQNTVVSRSTGSYAAYQRTAPTGQQTYDFYTINGVEVARITGDPSYLGFSTGLGTERMRIDSSGNVLVGTSSSGGVGFIVGTDAAGRILTSNVSAVPFDVYLFKNNGTTVGKITINTASTAYTTTSDYRLKENISPISGALDVVSQLKPVNYTWKLSGEATQGFIAHELQAVVPDCVVGEKDAIDADGNPVYQGVDTSFLVATLTAAIQEQQALITSLTARIAALEAA